MKRWKRFLLLGLVFVLLTGCTANHSESYRRALDIFASGEYEEAAQAFEKLGDYQQVRPIRRLFQGAGAVGAGRLSERRTVL